MTSYTPNLNLSTFDSASGSSTTFLTFRLAVAGLTSNMSILDSFAGDASASIIRLSSNQFIDVIASQVSTNVYESTTTAISNYITGMKINLKVNVTTTGIATLNINTLGAVTLKKVSISGTIQDLDSGDIKANRYYLFDFNGSYWILIGQAGDQTTIAGTSGHYVSISGSGFIEDSGVPILSSVTTGSFTQIIVDQYGRVTAGSYITIGGGGSGSVSGSGIMSDTTGSVVKHNNSTAAVGSYLSANLTVDQYGHITNITNGVSASSVGAPADSPFLTTASSLNLTNYKVITAGSNVTFNSGSGVLVINSSGGGGTRDYILIRHEEITGVGGGTSFTGNWYEVPINVKVKDSGSHCSISGSCIMTLASGKYEYRIKVPSISTQKFQTQLYNLSASAIVPNGEGSSEYVGGGTGNSSHIVGEMDLATTDSLVIKYQCEVGTVDSGLGFASNYGPKEIYATAEFWKTG